MSAKIGFRGNAFSKNREFSRSKGTFACQINRLRHAVKYRFWGLLGGSYVYLGAPKSILGATPGGSAPNHSCSRSVGNRFDLQRYYSRRPPSILGFSPSVPRGLRTVGVWPRFPRRQKQTLRSRDGLSRAHSGCGLYRGAIIQLEHVPMRNKQMLDSILEVVRRIEIERLRSLS
jgi:hypothetical protein